MTKLDDLKGLLSVRSINILKRKGLKYLEEITTDAVESIAGEKTKKEILDFIEKRRLKKCIN